MTTPGSGTGVRLADVAIALAFVFGLAAPPAAGQTIHLDPSDDAWEFTGDTRAGIVAGAPTLMMRTGEALRRDLIFEDSVIDFEYRGADDRSFLGVTFRVADDGTGEDIYLRLHKSKQPDALQYTPDFRGRGQWQLWHGPDAPLTAAIRNIRVTPREALDEEAAAPAPEPGVVSAWGVSRAFPRSGDDVPEIPRDVVSGPWSVIEARADGLLPLEPHVERPDGQGVPAVIAALRIEADQARTAANRVLRRNREGMVSVG